jgi:multiple sugar transport system permease protein
MRGVFNTNMEKKYSKYGYIFTSPFFLVFSIFSIYPILFTLYISLTRYKGYGKKVFIGLDNYKTVFTDPNVVQSFLNTLKIWGVNITIQLFLAFLLVMVFSDIKYKFKGLGAFRILFYLPNLIAATTVSLIFVKPSMI